jgi:beta-lactamase class A
MLAHAAASAGPAAADSAAAEFRRLEERYGGRLGIMAKHIGTGEVLRYRAEERFPTASVIKLPIMAAYFHLVKEGKVAADQRLELTAADKKPDSGLLQFLDDGATMSLKDAVRLMIVLSDNTATNLVLDRLAATHDERLAAVNTFLASQGLRHTHLLNRLYSWDTKKDTPEAIRYGIGVSTPEDMVLLLERIHARTLVDSAACEEMLEILGRQFYNDMIPRFLPANDSGYMRIAHKTGGVNETKVDVGLVLSDRADLAIAVFVDKHPDHRDAVDNQAVLLAAHASRVAWNALTGDRSSLERRVVESDVDWNVIPGGSWAIYRTPAAPFPHPKREGGFRGSDGTLYARFPHYADSSVVVVVPKGLSESAEGVNVIVHFHGHMNDNMGVLEQMAMPQALIGERVNALLVLPQGPNRARDSFGGKMEDPGGFERLVNDVLATMRREGVIKAARPAKVLVSAHSGGYRPAAYVLKHGGLRDRITDVFLFDAFYAEQDSFREWLLGSRGTLRACYTGHLRDEHVAFEEECAAAAPGRLRFVPTTVDHDLVVQEFFAPWLRELDAAWKTTGSGN